MSEATPPASTLDERRAYLLGLAPEAVRDRVEDELFESPDAHDALLALEQELVEGYLGDALSPEERRAFEARRASDPRLRQTLRLLAELDDRGRGQVKTGAPGRWRRLWWAAPALAATLLLFVSLREPVPEDPFQTKGEGTEVAVELTCRPRCVSGGQLVVSARPPASRPYLAAFTRRGDRPISWLVPGPGATSARLPPEGVWPEAFALSDPGTLEVYLVFSAGPLDRAAVAATLGDDLRGSPEVTVVRRSIEVEPKR